MISYGFVSVGITGGLSWTEMTRRVAKVCICVSGRICASLRERNSRQWRVDGRHCTVCIFVHLSVCVSFIKRRVAAVEGRKRDDPWLGSRGEMKKREETNRRKIEGKEEKE